MTDLKDLDHEVFAPLLEQVFTVEAESGDINLILSRVEPKEDFARGPSGRVPFSLLFLGPAEPILSQRGYALSHTAIGKPLIFLVPVGREGEHLLYEAVFS